MISRFEKLLLAVVSADLAFSVRAAPLTTTIQTPPPAQTGDFKLGTTMNPAGHGGRRLEILPLRQDAPNFIEPKDRPNFGKNESLVKLQSVAIVNFRGVEFGR